MLTTTKESLKALEEELSKIENSTEEKSHKIFKGQEISKKYCELLLQKAINYEFKDLSEQIEFFKIIKPSIFSHLFYYNRIKNIEARCIGNTNSFRKMILIEELGKKANFFESHNDLYNYFKSGRTECDNKYFSKFDDIENKYIGQGCEEIMLSAQDIIFSKFKAYENVERYLVDELQKIVYNDVLHEKSGLLNKIKSLGVKWTASDRDLVELIYGLNMLQCFNNGNIKLNKLFEAIKMIFHLSMSSDDFYNIGSQIRNRKKGNEISFFEKLKNSMNSGSTHFLK